MVLKEWSFSKEFYWNAILCYKVWSRDNKPAQKIKMAASSSTESIEYLSLDDDFDSILDLLENDLDFDEEINDTVDMVIVKNIFCFTKMYRTTQKR